MTNMPKLRIKRYFGGLPLEERICDLEEAREVLRNYFPGERWAGALIGVEGELVHSYEELMEIVKRKKGKEFIEVGIYPQSGGG